MSKRILLFPGQGSQYLGMGKKLAESHAGAKRLLEEANGEGWIDEHLGLTLLPAGPAGTTSALGGGSLAVLKDAANAEAAWKLVRWMAEPETQVSDFAGRHSHYEFNFIAFFEHDYAAVKLKV